MINNLKNVMDGFCNFEKEIPINIFKRSYIIYLFIYLRKTLTVFKNIMKNYFTLHEYSI